MPAHVATLPLSLLSHACLFCLLRCHTPRLAGIEIGAAEVFHTTMLSPVLQALAVTMGICLDSLLPVFSCCLIKNKYKEFLEFINPLLLLLLLTNVSGISFNVTKFLWCYGWNECYVMLKLCYKAFAVVKVKSYEMLKGAKGAMEIRCRVRSCPIAIFSPLEKECLPACFVFQAERTVPSQK